jgi:hypothetical protein
MQIVKKQICRAEFTFDNGAWVNVDCSAEPCGNGYWEYQSDADDEETYSSGSLFFQNKELVDYDGCFVIPREVVMAVMELGFSITNV